MALSDSDRAKVVSWMKSKVTQGCPMCGDRNWNAVPEISMAGTYDPSANATNPASGVPAVVTICGNCGFMAQFAAKQVGVI